MLSDMGDLVAAEEDDNGVGLKDQGLDLVTDSKNLLQKFSGLYLS